MSMIQPTSPSPAHDPMATHEVGGMLERMDAQGNVTERLLLSLGDWQVIPDEQGKLRILDAMHVTPSPALLRLRVWRSRIGVAWRKSAVDTLSDRRGLGLGERLEVAGQEKLIDCETDLQSGSERFRLIPSQQTNQTAWPSPGPQESSSASNTCKEAESRTSEQTWREAVGGLTRSLASIQAMVDRWHAEAQQRSDLDLSKERLRSLSSQLAFCQNQCENLGGLRLFEATATGDERVMEEPNRGQPIVHEVNGELDQSRNEALGLWKSLCAEPIEWGVPSPSDNQGLEKDPTWESLEEPWESDDSLQDWEVAHESKGGLAQIESPEGVEGGDEESRAVLQAELRREQSMREWLQGHFEGRQDEYLLLEQLLFQQPSRRGKDASDDLGSTTHRKGAAREQEVAVEVEQKEAQTSGSRSASTAAGRSDRVAVLFGCVLILGGIGMWSLNQSAWNSKFAGAVSGVIGSLWLLDSLFRLRTSGQVAGRSIEA
jgi:hypothetical protein